MSNPAITRFLLAVTAALLSAHCFGQNSSSTQVKPGEDMPKVERPAKTWDGPVQFLSGKAPALPISHVNTGSVGNVTVKFPIQIDGTVGKIEIVETTSTLLSELVVAAVKEWRFKPATKGGVAQIIWVQQSFSMQF